MGSGYIFAAISLYMVYFILITYILVGSVFGSVVFYVLFLYQIYSIFQV